LNKAQFAKELSAKCPSLTPKQASQAAKEALDILASDVRTALWWNQTTEQLTRTKIDDKVMKAVRGGLSQSIVFRAAMLEVAYKKPGRRKNQK